MLFNEYPPVESSLAATKFLRLGTVGYGAMDADPGDEGSYMVHHRVYRRSAFTIQFIELLYTVPMDAAPGTEDVALASELHAAHIAARLPVLIVMGAEMRLPRITKQKGATEHHLVKVALEVRWRRVAGVLGAILAGMVVSIAAAILHCRRFILHDHDSFLPVARLLKTAMDHAQGRSVDPAAKIAAQIKNGKGVARAGSRRMRYGTRSRDGIYEVDLWDDVENNFPEARYR